MIVTLECQVGEEHFRQLPDTRIHKSSTLWSVMSQAWLLIRTHWTLIDADESLNRCRRSVVIVSTRCVRYNESSRYCHDVRLSVCPSVCLSGTGVILWCTFARILVYGWIVQCSGHPDTKACPPTPSRLFPIPPGREVRYGCARRDISRTVEDRDLSYY